MVYGIKNVQDDANLTIRLHKVCAILNDLNAVKKCVISLKKPLHSSNKDGFAFQEGQLSEKHKFIFFFLLSLILEPRIREKYTLTFLEK